MVEFLQALFAHFRAPLLVIWDNSRPHRSHWVRDYVASTAGCIRLPFLPGYAPELNPVEFLWGWLKRHPLANFCPDSFAELKLTTRGKLKSASDAVSSSLHAGSRLSWSDVTELGKGQ